MPKLLDANAILRYLLNDDEEKAEIVRGAVNEGAATVPEVLCECVYVLQGEVYGFERSEVADALTRLLDDIGCERLSSMRRALDIYQRTRIDFVDCVLVAMSEIEGADVLTFDKNMLRIIEDER